MTASRIDKWLFCARLCRTRASAQDHIEAGRVRLNGARVQKPGHGLKPGDVLTLALGGALGGRVRVVKVLALAEKRGGTAEARELYEDLPD